MGVSVYNDGFILDGHEVPWSSVRAIATHKRDLLIYDEICLAFRLGEDSWAEVSEEEPGFGALVDEVARRYPAAPLDWFGDVMLPPFATNYRVLWGVA